MITWSQLKRNKKLSTKGRKAVWFKKLEDTLIFDKARRNLKPEFMFKGQYNPVVIKPKLKEISKKRSKKEWVITNENMKENWQIGRVVRKSKKTATIQKWKVVKEGPEKEYYIEREASPMPDKASKRRKIDSLKDVTN